MGKIPVGRTVAETYRFVVGRYFSILGVVWLPLVLLGAGAWFVVKPILALVPGFIAQVVKNPKDPAPAVAFQTGIDHLVPFIWLFDLFEWAILAVLAVGVAKLALGQKVRFRFAYLAFGLNELLVIGAFLFLLVMLLVYFLGAAIVGAVVGGSFAALGAFAAKAQPSGMQSVLAGLAIASFVIVLVFGGIYVAMRLVFFVVPVTIVEHEFGVFRSWQLMKGNFWRAFAVLFLSWLPVFVLEIAIFAAIAIIVGFNIASLAKSDPARVADYLAGLFGAVAQNFVFIFAGGFLLAPILYGLIFAPAAFAYRAIMPAEPAQPENTPLAPAAT